MTASPIQITPSLRLTNRCDYTQFSQDLEERGFGILASAMDSSALAELRQTIFNPGAAGTRCLLDVPIVRQTALSVGEGLVQARVLHRGAAAIQAIAFDKTPDANWKVTWHQDVMFPFAQRVSHPGYDLACVKEGVDYARPPTSVLAALLAVRLHLDECDYRNGPLRVAPGTHRLGVLRSTDIAVTCARHGAVSCLAREGEALLMRPLLLHASSTATEPRHRRVLHLVYHTGDPMDVPWFRRIQIDETAPPDGPRSGSAR